MFLRIFPLFARHDVNNIIETAKYFAVLIGILLVITIAAPATARADELFLAGSTAGCFGAACAPGAAATTGGLTFSNSTFTGTTAVGVRTIGGNPNPGSNVNNFGSISLSTSPIVYNTSFTLQVTFVAPQGIAGSNQATVNATVTGTVRSNNTGGVLMNFSNGPTPFSYNDPNCEPNPEPQPAGAGQTTCGAGNFYLVIFDTAIDPAQAVSIAGYLTQTTPTAPLVSIGGRVLNANGRPLSNARVTLTNSQGNSLIALSSPFGFYRFTGVEGGRAYTLTVASKGYQFSPVVAFIEENVQHFDLIAQNVP